MYLATIYRITKYMSKNSRKTIIIVVNLKRFKREESDFTPKTTNKFTIQHHSASL